MWACSVSAACVGESILPGLACTADPMPSRSWTGLPVPIIVAAVQLLTCAGARAVQLIVPDLNSRLHCTVIVMASNYWLHWQHRHCYSSSLSFCSCSHAAMLGFVSLEAEGPAQAFASLQITYCRCWACVRLCVLHCVAALHQQQQARQISAMQQLVQGAALQLPCCSSSCSWHSAAAAECEAGRAGTAAIPRGHCAT
jgi:hypothetical protein